MLKGLPEHGFKLNHTNTILKHKHNQNSELQIKAESKELSN